MSDPQQQNGTAATAPAAEPALPAVAPPERKVQAEQVVKDLLRLLECPVRLDTKDGAEGGISMALHFDGDVPPPLAQKRSSVLDAVQLLTNKIVNRPTVARHWVSLGVGAHPEPRPAKDASAGEGRPGREGKGERQGRGPREVPPEAARPRREGRSAEAGKAPEARAAHPAPSPGPALPDEKSLEVSEDPQLAQAIRALAEKSAKVGRFMAIAPMKAEDRARTLKAAAGLSGVSVHAEGEGRNRRVVFTPDKPAPLPSRHPADEEEE